LPEKRCKRLVVDVRRVVDLDVTYVLSCAFEQSFRIAQRRSPEETELHVSSGGVNVRHGTVAADPATISPLHGFRQLGFGAFHKPPKRTNDRSISGALILQVLVEARICLHSSHTTFTRRRYRPADYSRMSRLRIVPDSYNRRVHFVYIVRCADGTLYTGYARNPRARERAHNSGRGAKYTAGRRPVRLVYQEAFRSLGKALAREYVVKQLTRAQKDALVVSRRLFVPRYRS